VVTHAEPSAPFLVPDRPHGRIIPDSRTAAPRHVSCRRDRGPCAREPGELGRRRPRVGRPRSPGLAAWRYRLGRVARAGGRAGACPSLGPTPSSPGAARATSVAACAARRSSRASTTGDSSRPLGRSSVSTTCGSRSSMPTRNACRRATPPSISRSRSTGRRLVRSVPGSRDRAAAASRRAADLPRPLLPRDADVPGGRPPRPA
jgi:hypothetical protein